MKVVIVPSCLLAIVLTSALGCGQSVAPSGTAAKPASEEPGSPDAEAARTKHSGWWCDEHGLPEGVCSMCSAKVAADFQKAGDWCAEHDRAKSQCFKCNPLLKESFADQYRAKYGKEPPAMENDDDSSKT